MAMKAYESYKYVDLPWLKRVPEHWEVTSLARTAKEQKIKKPKSENFQVLSLSYGKIIKKKDINFGLVPKDYDNYQLLHPGNIVLRFTDLQNDHKSLRTGLVTQRGIITSAYVCIDPIENPAYIHYLLHHYDTIKLFYGMGNGIRQSIGYKDISDMRIPIPPKEEQDQIVRYLDWQNSRLNKLINAKKKEIALLEEQKQALISQAVTKGLDPNTPLKDSGIDWIGQIPEHWEIIRCKYLFTERNEFSKYGHEIHLSMSQKYGLIPDNQLHEHRLLSNSYVGGKLCYTADLVLNRLKAHLGVISIAKQSGVVSKDYTILVPYSNKILPKYAELLLRSKIFRPQMCIRVSGIVEGFWRLYTKDLYSICVPLPPISVQQSILNKLNNNLMKFETAISNININKSLLQEYRTRLVADVVTGQIDVRHIAIPNYETVTETIDQPETAENEKNNITEE